MEYQDKIIERYIYLGDIHSSIFFPEFIKKYNNGKTKFISVGDIFDRGKNTKDNIEIIIDLYNKGLYDMVLGNHDLFFILGIGLSERYNGFLLEQINHLPKDSYDYKKYKMLGEDNLSLLLRNGGNKTIASIIGEEFYQEYDFNENDNYTKENNKKLNDIAKFLWNNFNLYTIIDNNLIIHGGIPILNDGTVVNVLINNNMTNGGLDLLEKINNEAKNLNIDILDWMSNGINREYNVHNTIYDLKEHNLIKNKLLIEESQLYFRMSNDMTLTWFDNSKYFSNKEIGISIKKELEKMNCKALICGHWYNDIPNEWFNDIDSDYWTSLLSKKNTIIRLDRSYLSKSNTYGNFGYIIYQNGRYTQVGDVLDLLT